MKNEVALRNEDQVLGLTSPPVTTPVDRERLYINHVSCLIPNGSTPRNLFHRRVPHSQGDPTVSKHPTSTSLLHQKHQLTWSVRRAWLYIMIATIPLPQATCLVPGPDFRYTTINLNSYPKQSNTSHLTESIAYNTKHAAKPARAGYVFHTMQYPSLHFIPQPAISYPKIHLFIDNHQL